jgi:hypothetical protein
MRIRSTESPCSYPGLVDLLLRGGLRLLEAYDDVVKVLGLLVIVLFKSGILGPRGRGHPVDTLCHAKALEEFSLLMGLTCPLRQPVGTRSGAGGDAGEIPIRRHRVAHPIGIVRRRRAL